MASQSDINLMVAAANDSRRRRRHHAAATDSDADREGGDADIDCRDGVTSESHEVNFSPSPSPALQRACDNDHAMAQQDEVKRLQALSEQLMKGIHKLHDDRAALRQQHASDRAELAKLNALIKEYRTQAAAHDIGGCQFHKSAQLLEEDNNILRNELMDLQRVYNHLTRSRVVSVCSTEGAGNPFGDSLVEQISGADSDEASKTASESNDGKIGEQLDAIDEESRVYGFATNDLHTTLNNPNRARLTPKSPAPQRDAFHTVQNYRALFNSDSGRNTTITESTPILKTRASQILETSSKPTPTLRTKASQYFNTTTKLQASKSLYNLSPRKTSAAAAIPASPTDSACGWHPKGTCRRVTAEEARSTGAFCVVTNRGLQQKISKEEGPKNFLTAKASTMRDRFGFGRS